MQPKPSIAMIGPGRLGTALTLALHGSGYEVREIACRAPGDSAARARKLAKAVGARAVTMERARLDTELVWICVSDAAIAPCARALAGRTEWKGRVALHSSGALSSDELGPLREHGASVASLHPMMSFVHGSAPEMKGITFAVEGDARATRVARRIARDLGGQVFTIAKSDKGLYHAWGAFVSPLITSMLTLAEDVAHEIGLSPMAARRVIGPMLRQTVENYLSRGAAAAFSGPLVRGDVATVERHLQVLKKLPLAREAYTALARAALQNLPVANRKGLERALGTRSRH